MESTGDSASATTADVLDAWKTVTTRSGGVPWGDAVALFAPLFALGGCCHKQVVAFNVTPRLVCPGQTVSVTWEANGRAWLGINRGPNDWDQGLVPSKGERLVAVPTTTQFSFIGLDVDPAVGNSRGSYTVNVLAKDPRGNTAVCDATTRKCTATFTPDTGDGPLMVRRISAPTMMRRGTDTSVQLCVTHNGLAGAFCVPANGSLDVPGAGVSAGGTWTLEMNLATDEALTPPPRLTVLLDFGCQ
jgi:hypothetical protein